MKQEDADVMIVYHMINEAAAGHSPIRIICDGTDVLLILAHHLQARTNDIPATVQVSIEECSGNQSCYRQSEQCDKGAQICYLQHSRCRCPNWL